MQLFYNPNIDLETKEIIFSKEESRHIIKVLRKKEGDTLHITNGNGVLVTAEVIIASDKKCVANVVTAIQKEKEWNYHLHIAIAPTKNMDRLEWFVEKATEIGIDEITPIICDNSERKVVKTERLEKIMLAAMKQSLKYTKTTINPPVKFSDFITNNTDGILCIAHCETGDKKPLKTFSNTKDKITILIGPEGDFSNKEIKESEVKNFQPISLGKSRLRTETAALVATHTIHIIN
ncbi:16S rRNA (uracil(1498)-N(3))-methyltransferase [Tenacibaculum sp. M341]|uniref:16S rRNA (uracil(1498)-N(3))-methyltransferase n=1 Tax=Tenacibaculum sp. M341 TaxID=2530339 RepID=UPI001052AA07|nr:16S rRNA (uracil(1498)-N(3))-methyltransferase [Tenacibaculum sp. M341]TCI90314.1 16S rRNA (uracil(1498)-N(3))-methyltransferase [Tenacibaculum sp. M341]